MIRTDSGRAISSAAVTVTGGDAFTALLPVCTERSAIHPQGYIQKVYTYQWGYIRSRPAHTRECPAMHNIRGEGPRALAFDRGETN
jgi:hypothetical protein